MIIHMKITGRLVIFFSLYKIKDTGMRSIFFFALHGIIYIFFSIRQLIDKATTAYER